MLWNIDHRSRTSLQDQIAATVRRAIADGELAEGERLPPAQELADALDVDRNTVLAAYRSLRDAGVLEFRRGRGARIAAGPSRAAVDHAVRELVQFAGAHGYDKTELIRLIEEVAQ